ncbi:MAG: hypothetical protein IPP17_24785 [Bacteroidetes bacterium]|nr:hypothetical protein [Bacteroidota bacterium]
MATSVVICAVSVYGMSLISYDSYLLDDVSPRVRPAPTCSFEDPLRCTVLRNGHSPKNGKLVTDLDILKTSIRFRIFWIHKRASVRFSRQSTI